MKVLLVSIAFPPKRDPESLQVAKYCKYLNNVKGIDLEVVTSTDPTLFMETDDSLYPYAAGINVSKRIKIIENQYTNFIIRKISSNLLRYPDSKFTFWWQHRSILKAVQKPDLIYTRSYPMSSTLAGFELKKKWNVPWILHLSDPWAVADESSQSPAALAGGAKRWNSKKEQECFALADKICLTSQKTIELYVEEYPQYKDKFVYIPNVFDDAVVRPNPFLKKDKLTFVYTGGFADFRSPYTLLEAIRKFWKKNPKEVEDQVQFLFTGEMARVNHGVFRQYEHIPVIRHLGVIQYSEVLNLQRKADVLINVDTNILEPRQAVYFPSKLLDYIVAQRRILAITNSYSTTQDVVQGKLGDCFDFHEIDRLAQHFSFVLEKYQQGDDSYFQVDQVSSEFSARKNAERLANLFLEFQR